MVFSFFPSPTSSCYPVISPAHAIRDSFPSLEAGFDERTNTILFFRKNRCTLVSTLTWPPTRGTRTTLFFFLAGLLEFWASIDPSGLTQAERSQEVFFDFCRLTDNAAVCFWTFSVNLPPPSARLSVSPTPTLSPICDPPSFSRAMAELDRRCVDPTPNAPRICWPMFS